MFEARKAKDSAIIAENDGQVVFGKEVRGKQRVSIVPEDGSEPSNYLIPKGKHINFNQGEKIKKGEYLLDGQPLPHDILRICLLYTSPSPRDVEESRMPSSA